MEKSGFPRIGGATVLRKGKSDLISDGDEGAIYFTSVSIFYIG